MQISLIRSGEIDFQELQQDIERASYCLDEASNYNASYSRRNFIGTLGGGAVAAPLCLLAGDRAWAQYNQDEFLRMMVLRELLRRATLLAALQQLLLSKATFQVDEPTSGEFRIINPTHEWQRGNVIMAVKARGSLNEANVEDYEIASYGLPPRSYEDREFSGGPSGKRPGRKDFVIGTRRGQQSTPMQVVYA